MISQKLGVLSALSLALSSVALAQVAPPATKGTLPNAPLQLVALTPAYHVDATWKVAGEGGWDYLTDDSSAHRLYIARGARIQVLNTDSGELVGEVPGVDGSHGVAIDPNTHRGYATSGRSNTVVVFDTQTLKPIGTPIPVGERPDAIAFEPVTKRVFAFDAGGNAASIIDTTSGKVVQTVPLGSNPETGVADGLGHMWVNLEGSSEIAEINALDGTIMVRTSLAPGDGPTGLSYDAKTGRLFAGCSNKTMVVVDGKTGKVVTTLPVGQGVDAGGFDPNHALAFAPNGRDGTLSVIGMNGAQLAVLSTVPTHVGARTMAVDSATGAVFVIAADYEAPQPGDAAGPGGRRRPRIVAGSTIVMKLVPGTTP